MLEENPLINLKDIHLPPAVEIWPPAPGWWIVVVVLLLIIVFCGMWISRRFEQRKPKTEALRLLKNLQKQPMNSGD